ncbi:MAG TPA: M24 family metallopeptidase [Chloroflexota bacterium]|nr:M24 family metallopeptidase [Chloroflexota bacterium]
MTQETMYDYRRFSIAERDRRWKAVRALMARDGIDVIIAPPNNGNSTDWQADARYLSHCGGGADASIGCVFPIDDEPTVVATSAIRWGPRVQNWVSDVRDVNRHYGRAMAERLRELKADGKRIGICGLAGGTRTPEGTILHGTYEAIAKAVPNSEIVNATDLLQEVRCVKSQEEIDVLQDSVDLVERAVEAEVEWAAKPGVRDYEVWAAAMNAMFSRGSELSVHFNWIAHDPPTRTLTRPQRKILQDGEIIINELESSIIGYRAQQVRPVAVRRCDPLYMDLIEYHGEMYARLLDFLRPGVTLAEAMKKTQQIGDALRPASGPLANATARFVCHGRGLGDDVPLATNDEAIERYGDWRFPENGVFIIKPSVSVGASSIAWGDTCRVSANGTVRMGHAPHEMIVAR